MEVMPLSLAIAGPVADAVGLRPIWYVSAAAIFIVTGLAFFSRDLMNIENQPAGDAQRVEDGA